jgi:hypothetical protein
MGSRKFLGLFFLFLVAPLPSWACVCSKAPPGVCPGLQKDDVVFLGTVIQAETLPATSSDSGAPAIAHYRFHVDEKFAGADAPEMDVYSGGEDGDCAYHFALGTQYIVFPNRADDGRLFATICSSTRPALDARALLPQLRAMRDGTHVASVYGVLRRTDPPLLAPEDDPEDPLPHIKLRLRSKDDRFATSTGPDGVYSFYDVHAGEYRFTADLPARFEFTQKTLKGALPPFKIPNGACYEYNVDALPTGKIHGSVLAPNRKPLPVASVELYRAGRYDESQPGLWGFQSESGSFEFDHIGPGEYILVFNRMNRKDPNSPFPRAFYPGVPDAASTEPIKVKEGQQLQHVNIKLSEGYPTRPVRVLLKWEGKREPGEVTVTATADAGENPAAHKISDGVYEFMLLESAGYTISAWEDVDPHRPGSRAADAACPIPARIDAAPVVVSGSDADAKEIALVFPSPVCPK